MADQLLVNVISATVPAGATSYAVPHGLKSNAKAVAPTLILPVAQSAVSVATADAMNIYLANPSGAPAAVTLRLERGLSNEVDAETVAPFFQNVGTGEVPVIPVPRYVQSVVSPISGTLPVPPAAVLSVASVTLTNVVPGIAYCTFANNVTQLSDTAFGVFVKPTVAVPPLSANDFQIRFVNSGSASTAGRMWWQQHALPPLNVNASVEMPFIPIPVTAAGDLTVTMQLYTGFAGVQYAVFGSLILMQ